MAKDLRIVRRAFNAGEVSPQFAYRNDTEKHAFACSKLENFYVSPIGAISRRSGTRLLGVLGSAENSDNVRILPFEYNREFSYIFALHTTDASNGIKWETEAFSLPAVWSMCWTIPASVDGAKDVLTKGNLTVSIDASANLIVSTAAATAIAAVPFGAEHKVAVVRDGTDSISIYVDGELKGSNGNFVFTDDGGSLVMSSMDRRGDTWDLKVLNYDITRSDAWYKLQDFSDGKDETAMIIKTPNWDGQESLYGSTVENGVLKYDWEAASAKRLAQVRANVDLQSLHGTIVSTEAHIAKLEAFIGEHGGGEGAEEGLQAAKATLAESQAEFRAKCAEECGAASWSALLAASGYESDEFLYQACMNGDHPIVSFKEVITIPFKIIRDANISYSATANDVSATLIDGDAKAYAVVSGAAEREYHLFRLEFTMTKECSCSYICNDFRAQFYSLLQSLGSSWTSDKVIKLDVFTVDGEKIAENIATPIPSEFLHEFQYKQVNGYIFIAHADFSPKRFEFKFENGQQSATWTEAATFHPSTDTAESGVVITCGTNTEANRNGIIFAGNTGTISANSAFFTHNMVGSQLKLEYSDKATHTYKWPYRKENNGQHDGAYIGASTAWLPPTGKVVVKPEGGIWEGVLILEESTDNGKTWVEIGRSSAIQGSENSQFEREIYDVRSLVRARLIEQRNVADTSSTQVESATEGCFFNIYTNSTCCAWVEIQTVSGDGKSATVKFINPARAYFQTDKVYRSAWSDTYGYPRTVDIHEERLALGGNRRQPATVWLSQTNNWDNFRSVSNLDTDPLAYSLASDDGEPISWIVSKSDLMIGLGSSEWSLGSRDASQSLTAKIVKASNQSQDGVEYIMPAKAANMVIYVRRGDRELGSISYDFASDAYNSISLTTMCPEILDSGVKTLFNQLSPRNYIWVLRNDGVCGVFTYDRENNVSAWARFTFGDGVISACALSTGKFRSVFLIVKRDGYLCLERLDPNEMDTDNWLDCVPISANVEVPEGLSTGVRYASRMETTPIFLEGHIKVHCAEFIMLNSYGGQYRLKGFNDAGEPLDDERDWRNLAMRSGDILGNPAPKSYRFTGNCQSGYLEECSIEVKTDERAPFTLCAIAVKAGGV